MATSQFSRESAATPTSIGLIRVRLEDGFSPFDPDNLQRGVVQVEVLDQNGDAMKRIEINMRDVVPAATLQQISQFLTALRTRAESEILPGA